LWFGGVRVVRLSCRWRRFQGPGEVLGVGRAGAAGSGGHRERERCGEGGGEVVRPGPGLGDADLAFSLAADDAGGGVQESVAQGLRFGLGQVAGQAQQP
jgi:hypothetical protein